MPKSKRSKLVSLTRTEKKTRESKGELMDELRECVDTYNHCFVFSVDNMRNNKLKDLRLQWRSSRFFFGKNKVMQVALGRTAETEYQENIREIANRLVGNVGLLFTDESKKKTIKWFSEYAETEFARSGTVATNTIRVAEGPLPQFSHALEPHLRKLGLPTALKKGVVTLLRDHTICTAGETLTPEQADLLKLFEVATAEFRLRLTAVWSKKGSKFEELE
eukprot:m.14208 g.14208  ORF g.14208 m.14208 type:complete len:220 (+) comp3350_c0_seq2:33-692(+)